MELASARLKVITTVNHQSSPTLERPQISTPRPPAGALLPRHGEVVSAEAAVLIASPSPGLRKRWREAIDGHPVLEVAEYGQLARMLAMRKPSILLLDQDLLRLGGMDSVGALRRLHPAVKIVILAGRPDDAEGVAALKMGARGYCDRDITLPLLARALEAVRRGEVWVGRKLTARLLEEMSALSHGQRRPTGVAEPDGRLQRLTPRERDIVDLLSAGASNKEIAQRLVVTERTVKAHLTAVFRKLGMSGRLQAALFVAEHGRSPRRPAGAAEMPTTKVQLTT